MMNLGRHTRPGCIYIYVYMCTTMCVYIYIYVCMCIRIIEHSVIINTLCILCYNSYNSIHVHTFPGQLGELQSKDSGDFQ